MNWLLIIIVLVLAAYTIHGYQKGMLRILFSLFSLLLTIIFVAWATPYIGEFLKENTKVYQTIEEKCEQSVRTKMQAKITEESEQQKGILENYGIVLPKSIEETLLGKAQSESDNVLETNGIYEEMAKKITDFIINGIAFFLALIICVILMHFLEGVIDIVSKIPILKGVNKILGIIAGLLQGLIMVWLFFYLVTIFQNVSWGQKVLSMIQSSNFLSNLYENNIILYLITLFL